MISAILLLIAFFLCIASFFRGGPLLGVAVLLTIIAVLIPVLPVLW